MHTIGCYSHTIPTRFVTLKIGQLVGQYHNKQQDINCQDQGKTITPHHLYIKNGKSGRIRTPSRTSTNSLHNTNKTHTQQSQKLAKSNTYKNQKNSSLNKTNTSSKQANNASLHKKCAICVHQYSYQEKPDLSSDLIELVSIWEKLPGSLKGIIGRLVKAYMCKGGYSDTSKKQAGLSDGITTQ